MAVVGKHVPAHVQPKLNTMADRHRRGWMMGAQAVLGLLFAQSRPTKHLRERCGEDGR
jgi:hypothetical protein